MATESQEKSVAVGGTLASILIPCVGMLEYTKLCVASVLKHTRAPFELIFVDIGSLDGTFEFLSGVAMVQPQVRVEIVRTPSDLGIKDAIREAIHRIRGEYVVLLNNDTIVTNGWLNQMIGLAGMSPVMGLVGPMSSYAAPPQLVEAIPYRTNPKRSSRPHDRQTGSEANVDVDAINAFALEFREKNKGKWLETERLGGFCLLMKREVLKRIDNQGQLDKWTDLSLFDSDIVSAKAREAGFTLGVCRDLFIHHFGTRTFAHGAPHAANDKR
ncbi:MAG: glycosyltransferase [Gemmataceae bacterium]|nr:glycosyltransferase [Gemmataceae bacterium]